MKLSIITPSYNQGSYISETFDSILGQQVKDIEYIVMDAQSTDNTRNIAKEYKEKFKRNNINFIFISEPDKGQSDAINKGWKLATGDVITYINSDDYYTKNSLNKVMSFFKKNPDIMWAYGGWRYVDKDGNPFLENQPTKYSKDTLLNYCNIGQPSCFFRKNLLNEFGLLNTNLHLTMDYDLWLRFASKYNAGIISGILSSMRYHQDAKSIEFTKKQLYEVYNVGSKYTKPFSYRRSMQFYYLVRGLLANQLGISKVQRGLK